MEGKASTDPERKVSAKQKEFLREFAIRIYRALTVFKKINTDKSVSLETPSKHSVRGAKHAFDTRLDVILALLEFYRRNRDFVVFTAKRCHSGFNKVNWPKTVAKKTPIFQSDDEPVYVQTVNKKKRIDFDEELLVIFPSILHYIAKTWGFPVKFDLNYEPITGAQFKRYLNGYGAARLRAIKYRYFSDKLLELWELCYLFFKFSRSSSRSATPQEYLYAKKFDVVFEAMIDELIGDSLVGELGDLKKLKEQADGKRADHIYLDKSILFDKGILGDLFNDLPAETRKVCCIGDSKYYGIGNEVGKESIAKQFTYARNVIQWNIEHYLDNPESKLAKFTKLRDDATEGYDIVPNFFISASAGKAGQNGEWTFDKDRLFSDDDFSARDLDNKKDKCFSRQFTDRLFDRDTLHLAHFDVNFFYVIALYGRNNPGAKEAWKNEVHKKIREKILAILKDRYCFYKLQVDNPDKLIQTHFKELIGIVYPVPVGNGGKRYLLALQKEENQDKSDTLTKWFEKIRKQDADLFAAIKNALTPLNP